MGRPCISGQRSEATEEGERVRYTPMRIPCDLCEASFKDAMAALGVPIYLHVHASKIDLAREIIHSPKTRSEFTRQVEAIVDDSITNPEEWFLQSAIGSNPS